MSFTEAKNKLKMNLFYSVTYIGDPKRGQNLEDGDS